MLWLCLLQALDADTLEERERAVLELIVRGDEAAARESLKSSDPEVRARAAAALEEIQLREFERDLPAFLAERELPPDDLQPMTPPFPLRRARIFRIGRGWESRLVALRPEGILLSEPFSEGNQTFVVDVLRDRRARNDDERVALARDCVALMDLFDLGSRSSPGVCLSGWGPMPSDREVFWGGMMSRNPGMRAQFAPEGRLLSADFWYRD